MESSNPILTFPPAVNAAGLIDQVFIPIAQGDHVDPGGIEFLIKTKLSIVACISPKTPRTN
jgi:hypothetical protein